jgi:hypothetical protein
MAGTPLSALTALSTPTLDDLLYLVDDPAGTPLSRKATLDQLGGLLLPSICQGRLTTESGVPVSTSDRTAQGTLYFTPYNGALVSLHDGTRWKLYAFTERSLALSGLTSPLPYDVFLYDNAGTLTLEFTAWTNGTTRATALTTQDGVLVKTGATTRRYLGTFYTTGAATTEDSGGGVTTNVGGKRFVWNYYNRVPRTLALIDTTDSWTYGTNSWRQWNNAAANQIEFVIGDASALVDATFVASAAVGTAGGQFGLAIGLDGLSPSGHFLDSYNPAQGLIVPETLKYVGTPGIGYHYLAGLERSFGAATVTFIGDNTGFSRAGLFAVIAG